MGKRRRTPAELKAEGTYLMGLGALVTAVLTGLAEVLKALNVHF